MDYVEDNGVSIKVDYIISEEDCLYIAFNVKNEEDFDRIFIKDIEIINQNGDCIYNKSDIKDGKSINFERKFIDDRNVIMVGEILNYNKDVKEIKISIKNLFLKNETEEKNKFGNWNIEFNI